MVKTAPLGIGYQMRKPGTALTSAGLKGGNVIGASLIPHLVLAQLLIGCHYLSCHKEIKDFVENQLDKNNWDIDIVLSHTCPKYYEPIEWFLSGLDQSTVDKSTEIWLDNIFEKLNFKKWYCGHYHGSKKIDGFQFMYNDFDSFRIGD